ncbi:MAG: hypothetical protein ABI968_05685 [Acidobacteriota bacterium]
MARIRCGSRNRRFALMLLVSALVGTPLLCASSDAPSNLPLEGETIFRGLFFGSGPVARMLPEIWSLTGLPHPDPDAPLTGDQTALLGRLAADDPSFFDRFGRAMSSGDRLLIQGILAESAGRIDSVLRSSEAQGPTADTIIKTHTATVIGINTYAWIYRDTAIALVTDSVIFLVPIDPGGGGNDQKLRNEILVDLLATRLAA